MNKKLRFLCTVLMALFVGGVSWAQEFSIKFQNSKRVVESPQGYFTYNKGEGTAVSWSSKGKHKCTYNGETYSDVIKMESATQAYFTSTAKATVTIVQTTSNATGDKLKFDGATLDANLENTTVTVDAANTCNIYTITNVAAGKHTITRVSETGLAYIKVVYTGSVMTVLDTPSISFDSATGEVTIGSVTNASSIIYTIDGTEPSADNGTPYEAPFTVEDGTIVKAIALGDDKNYTNSEIATEEVLLDITSVATPTISSVYGTFALSCETPNVTMEYSTDGSSFTAYTKPVTLFEDATVYARATRDEIVSEVATAEVQAVPKGAASKSIVLYFDAFDVEKVNGLSTLVGKGDTEGYSISLNNSLKAWSSGNSINDYKSIKVSNGAQNTLYLPQGVSATRITIYSYINSAPGRDCGWNEIGDLDTQYKDVLMGAWNDAANPDVRTYPLTGEESYINFTNIGEQLCFYIVLDVADARAELTAEYAPKQLTTIEGEEIEQPVLSIKDENGNDVEGLTVGYESSNTDVATVAEDGTITVVGAGEATITATVDGGETYKSASASVKISVVAADAVLSVTEFTEVVLTKENIDDNGYLSVTTDNWNTDKIYGDGKYVGDFYNMSQAARQLSIKVKGAKAFEALVQNTNAGRTYTVTVGGGDAQTIAHGATGVESSGIIECADGIITITLAGTGSSVYPVAIKLYPELPVTKSISAAGYATLYSDKALDFTAVDGLTAYVGTLDGSTVRFTAVEKVAAGTGVLLKGAEGDYVIPVAADATGAAEGDLLLGVLEDTEIEATDANGTNFVLMDGASGVGFYKVSDAGFTVGAGTAYLSVPTAEAGSKLFIGFDGDTATAIETIGKADTHADAPAYNLAGQRVNNGYKGIVVRNGRKVVNK